ncbi:MAG: hypothetical protein ACFFG0_37085 [Candidatus Thorarchaeota archaeon]
MHKKLGAIKVQEVLAALFGGEGALDIHVGLGDVYPNLFNLKCVLDHGQIT